MAPNHRALFVALVIATSAALVGFAGPATADHGAENGNYTVELPFATDHYPRDKNPGGPYNGSINHFAGSTPEQFEEIGAPNYMDISYIVIQNQHIDFSQCTTENTAAFGIDRGNNNSGTATDENLLDHRKDSSFNDNSIVIEFYQGEDLAAPEDSPPRFYPEDAIVAHQGYKSSGGACYGMPEEPGWYQIQGYMNGTNSDGQEVEVTIPSHYFYICECDSEAEARQQLGPPPSERSEEPEPTATATPTATPTPTATEVDGDGDSGSETGWDATSDTDEGDDTGDTDATGDADRGSTPTPRQTTATAADDQDQGGSDASDGGDQQAQQSDQEPNTRPHGQDQRAQRTDTAVPTTPTIAEGPGFGPGLVFVALLGTALLGARR